MASSLLDSIGNYLETNMDTCTTLLYDSVLLESQGDETLSELRRHKSSGGTSSSHAGKVKSVRAAYSLM